MILENGGARDARRWRRILCLGLTASLMGGCTTDKMGPKPPTHCSSARARPANPNGSVLMQPTVIGAVPNGSADGSNNVMVFGSGTDAAKPESAQPSLAAPETIVPAVEAPPATTGANQRRRSRPISMGPQAMPGRTFYGSC